MITLETDAELEKFIEGRLEYFFENSLLPLDFYRFELKNELNEVAKRARERAIGEYHAKIMNWLTGRGLGRIATDLNSHLLKSL